MADDYGVIDLSEVVKAPRGATAEYEPALEAAMTKTFKDGKVLTCDPHAEPRADYPATTAGETAHANAKQKKAAMFKKHFKHLLAEGVLPAGKINMDWNPDTGVCQIRYTAA